MMPSFSDYRERRQIIRETFPDDLLEDLQDSEPELYNEAQDCDAHIANFVQNLKTSVSPRALLPSILTAGWNHKKHKFGKNWPDMENLLKLYALGLYFKDKPLSEQAEYDKAELIGAVETASISPKHKKGIPAQKRLDTAKRYLRFGMRTLDAFFIPDNFQREYALDELDREIYETSNDYHSQKLNKSKEIALSVASYICRRYR